MQHKDAHGVYYHVHAIVRTYIHTAWAQCCLFGIEGNTRALTSGTARLQSRFLFVYVPKIVPRVSQHYPDSILSRYCLACLIWIIK